MNNNNKKVFYNFIFTYFAIIFLVLICLFPIYVSLAQAEHDKATQMILDYKQSSLRELDSEENRLFHTVRNFYMDHELKQLYYSGSQDTEAEIFYNMSKLQEKLKLYFQNEKIVRSVMVYIPKYDYVLTQKYIFKSRFQFYEYNYFDSFSQKDWLTQLFTLEYNQTINAGMYTDFLNGGETFPVLNQIFTFPMAGDSNVKVLILVSLDSKQIAEQLLLPTIRHQSFSIITDKEGTLLAKSNPFIEDKINLGNEMDNYWITTSESLEKNIIIGVEKQFFDFIQRKTLWLITQSIGIALLLSACVALYFAWNRSKPLEHVLDIIRKANITNGGGLELEDLECTVVNMVSEIRKCEGTIKNLDTLVSHNLLERLFFGGLNQGNYEESFIQYFGLMPTPCVAVVFSHENVEVEGLSLKIRILNGFGLTDTWIYACHVHNQKVYLLLQAASDMEELITFILKTLREHGEGIVKAGLSNSITTLHAVKEGSLQAQRRLDAGYHIQGAYLFAHTHSSRPTRNLFNVQLLDAFQRSLLTGNKQTTNRLMDELFRHLKQQKPDAVELRQIFFSLRSVYSIVINQFSLDAERSGEQINDCIHLPNDLDEYSSSSIKCAFSHLNETIYDYYQNQCIRNKRVKGFDIISYIEENFRDPNLCASSIASRFYLSEKYVFQLVKGVGGETLNDKISLLRVDEGIRLLEHSDKTVTEIALKTGFTSANSMYKVFMRIKGIPPSTYRKKN